MKYLVGRCLREECSTLYAERMVVGIPLYANEAQARPLEQTIRQARSEVEMACQSHASNTGHTVEINEVIRP